MGLTGLTEIPIGLEIPRRLCSRVVLRSDKAERQKALHAQGVVQGHRPQIEVMAMPHPSPLFINRASGNRERVLASLMALSARIAAIDGNRLAQLDPLQHAPEA